jgi:hypothetical protein
MLKEEMKMTAGKFNKLRTYDDLVDWGDSVLFVPNRCCRNLPAAATPTR